MELKPIREIEKMSPKDKMEYFSEMRDFCVNLGREDYYKKNIGREIIMNIYPLVANYDYRIRGAHNIPENPKVLFVCNHSNSHDFFAVQEIFRKLGRRISVLAGSDCLNYTNQTIFKMCDARLIDRNDKTSTEEGIKYLVGDIANGMAGFIFLESTWNLHPFWPMLPIKIGGTLTSAIADCPIVPLNLEYVEVPHACRKESELYTECVATFYPPIYIYRVHSLASQSGRLLSKMRNYRMRSWQDLGITHHSRDNFDVKLYLNHTYLKKFGAFGFKYDTLSESKFIFRPKGEPFENEYTLDENGLFVPGITTQEEGKKYVKTM